jgi:hypothetical protein
MTDQREYCIVCTCPMTRLDRGHGAVVVVVYILSRLVILQAAAARSAPAFDHTKRLCQQIVRGLSWKTIRLD